MRAQISEASTVSRPEVSSGPVARFEYDHGSLGRPPPGESVELWIDRDPALPQPITLLASSRAPTHLVRMLAGQPNDGFGMRLEVEPPRRVAFVLAVHRIRDEVRAVHDVADDDVALLPGLPPDGRVQDSLAANDELRDKPLR